MNLSSCEFWVPNRLVYALIFQPEKCILNVSEMPIIYLYFHGNTKPIRINCISHYYKPL